MTDTESSARISVHHFAINRSGMRSSVNVYIKDNDLIVEALADFDVGQTLECGQCFHFEKLDENEYALAAFGRLLHIKQTEDKVIFYNTTFDDFENIWKNYFDLERDYAEIKKILLSKDEKLKEAIDTMYGVRLLNQEFVETLISFIISQNKQIPHIKQIVANISKQYGEYLGEISGHSFYSFPDIARLQNVTEEDLRECKTGFRAPYIRNAIELVCQQTITVQQLSVLDTKSCCDKLKLIKGVGNKVANCVMLFGLGKRDAFPVDVWIKRIMETLYFNGQDTANEVIEKFANDIYGEFGGYAQQYLFYYGKTRQIGVDKVNKKEKVKPKTKK